MDLTKNKPWMSKLVPNIQHHQKYDHAPINTIKLLSITFYYHLFNLLRCDLFNELWIEPPVSKIYITADNDKEFKNIWNICKKLKYISRQVTLDTIIYFLNMWSWILTYSLIYGYECISLSWDLGNLFSSTQVRSYSTDQKLFLSFIYHIDEVISIQSNRKIIG